MCRQTGTETPKLQCEGPTVGTEDLCEYTRPHKVKETKVILGSHSFLNARHRRGPCHLPVVFHISPMLDWDTKQEALFHHFEENTRFRNLKAKYKINASTICRIFDIRASPETVRSCLVLSIVEDGTAPAKNSRKILTLNICYMTCFNLNDYSFTPNNPVPPQCRNFWWSGFIVFSITLSLGRVLVVSNAHLQDFAWWMASTL